MKKMIIIERTRPNVHYLCNKAFLPGMNAIREELFETLKKDQGFKQQIELGFLKVISGGNPPSNTSKSEKAISQIDESEELEIDLDSMTVKEVVAFLNSLISVEDIKAILDADMRKGVQKAGIARLKELDNVIDNDSFLSLTDSQAVEIIKKTFSLEALKEISEMDSRPAIQEAIKTQKLELKNLGEVKKIENDGDSAPTNPNKANIS